jgi:hypothetical protein
MDLGINALASARQTVCEGQQWPAARLSAQVNGAGRKVDGSRRAANRKSGNGRGSQR